MRPISLIYVSLALAPLVAQPALAAPVNATGPTAQASTAADDARLVAFLDREFAAELTLRPELATYLGLKVGADRWSDSTDAGRKKLLDTRRASVARMKASFDRDRLSADGRLNYDIWADELNDMELQEKFRLYRPPFYSTLYSANTQLPDFLINAHEVNDVPDMRAWIARVRGLPAQLDLALTQTQESAAAGIRVPKFQIERIIKSSQTIVGGAPFGGEQDSPLMADARTKIAKIAAAGKLAPGESERMLKQASDAILAIQPAYQRTIAWAQSALPDAPEGKLGAVTLPGGAEWYTAALKLNTTLDLTADEVHAIGLSEVARIEGEQDALARQAGSPDREAFYAERARLFPAQPYTDALRADYLARANAAIAHNRELLGARFNLKPEYRIEVIREPSFSEVPGGAAHAADPSPDGVRPGRVYLHLQGNTLDPAKTTDLMCHEGVPGHVMAGDIGVRQVGVPKFRAASGSVAYGEGWALYAE